MSTLRGIKPTYRLPMPVANVKHDIVVISELKTIIAVVDGTLCDATQKPEHRILFRHSFVLRHSRWLDLDEE